MEKSEVIAKYALKEGDTGSPEVQIALLTERINHLNEHLKEHTDFKRKFFVVCVHTYLLLFLCPRRPPRTD